jgi:lipopolysaccharide exporter
MGDVTSEALEQATITGVRWLAFMRVASETIALLAAVVLARLVTPAEFGRGAVALIFIMLSVMLTFEGFASALVQRASVSQADRRAAMLMSIVGGCILSLAVYAAPVWRPLFGARTAELIQLSSPSMLIASLGGVSRAAVWRKLDFRRVSTIDGMSLVVGSAASVSLAFAGAEAEAIVIGGLVQTATTTLLLLIAEPPPLPGWSGRSQRQIVAFGIPAALAALVDTLFRNIDYAILAARLPAAQAGFYYRAFNVGVVYQDKLSRIMTQIGFPLYSRVVDRDELRRLHERVARLHAVVIFPLLASLVVLAPLLVPLVFGAAWTPAVVPTQILVVAGMVAAILTGYPQLMLALGRPRALLHFNIAMLVVYAGAVFAASSHGLVAVSITVGAVHLAILAGVYRFLLQRYMGISLLRLVPELGPAVVGCLALLAVTVPLASVLGHAWPRAATVAVTGSVGMMTYALVLRTGFPAAWADLNNLLVRVFPILVRVQRRRTLNPAAAP